MILGIKVINDESNPTRDEKEDDGDGLTASADVHLEDFENGLNAKADADDVDNCCYHGAIVFRVNLLQI